mmetsp:Transcript_17265/g.25680  ORF Transcript_17265/g.25680 Transcript_17265/m.25680 type:complete len:137 (+) Transcript_17265:946-1356(+)
MFIWQFVAMDPVKNYWIYQTIPGIILLCFRAATMFYFIFNIVMVYREETRPDKRRFYIFMGAIGSLWFASLPLWAGIGSALDDWVALKATMALDLTSTTLFFLVVMVTMWPSISDRFFEFTPPGAFDASSGHYDEL